MTIISYIILGLAALMQVFFLYLVIGMIVSEFFEKQFNYYGKKSAAALQDSNYDLAAYYNDKRGTAARRADFISKLTFLDI